MLDTAARPMPEAIPGTCPEARKTIGTTPDMPAPRQAKPAIAAAGWTGAGRSPKPTAAIEPPTRTTVVDPNRVDEPIAEDPPEGHRHAEGREAERGDCGGRAELVAQVDAAPVRRGAFDEQAGEGERAKRQQSPRRAHEDRVGVADGVDVGAEEAPRPGQADDGCHRGDDRKLHAHVEPGGRREGAERAAGQPADRERGVEAREDRAAVGALHGDAVCVHGDVERAHGGAVEQHQHARAPAGVGAKATSAVIGAQERKRRARRAAAADARGAPAGDRYRDDRADGPAGQCDAQLAVGQPDVIAHRRDARRPRAEDQPVEEEDRGDGAARLARGPSHARSTSMPRSR